MGVVCDTGGVYALYDADDAHHAAVAAVIRAERGPLYVPIALVSEIDYLLSVRLGVPAVLDFLASVTAGAFTLAPFTSEDLSRCRQLIDQYRDLPLGLADAAVVSTAERLQLDRILTVDQRHFRTVRPQGFDHFRLLPADSELGP